MEWLALSESVEWAVRDGWLLPPGLAWRAFDLGACFVWTASGAHLAARKGFDVTGIFAVALVSSTGGGLLRDGLFLQTGPPALVRTPAYIVIAAGVAIGVWLLGKRAESYRGLARIVTMSDALGLGAFAVVGMHLALGAGLSLPGVALVGVVNAVGGGILRSVLLHEVSEVFRPGELTALAALIGCIVYLVLTRVFTVDDATSAGCTMVVVAAVRILSVRYRFKTLAARGFAGLDEREDQEEG